MGISPSIKSQYQTQTAPLWTMTLTTDSGTANLIGLSKTALTIYFKNISSGVETQGQGDLEIVQSNPAIISYQPVANDVAIGLYHVRLWVAFSNGSEPFDLGTWTVEP